MLTDFKLKQMYKDHLLDQIKKELNPSDNELKVMSARLNATDMEDIARVADAFDRFGVKVIMDIIMDEGV